MPDGVTPFAARMGIPASSTTTYGSIAIECRASIRTPGHSRSRSQRQLELIDELLAARLPSGWAVKDSFCTLDLASRGFRVLFDAEWIYLPVSRMKVIDSSARWEIVRDDLALAEWESAWGRSAGDASEDRIFLPSLLDDKDIAMVACYRDGHIVAGAVANRSDGVVGWSNFFAPAAEILDRARRVACDNSRSIPRLADCRI